ncbi:MAG: hypothetical protein Q2306_00030 [Phytoplasma sp.]|uniref:hypothetical protein n=1 Tax=Phytoplasma sp. TaxID=2155 RepID=UPI002B404536|nr:hypothetical protein [Phytoplasma sp.]WRH06743.1 MAG: hypothetical protein Q2306_00030 [Phytoplasma sp.]
MNFFKKHETTIYTIIIFVIIIGVGICLEINDDKQEQKSLSNYQEELEEDTETNQSLRIKHSKKSPKPKIKITKEKFDKIKYYVLSEKENEVLSPENLSEEEKTEINKIKQKLVNDIKNDKDVEQPSIDQHSKECDELNTKINTFQQQIIKSLQNQLTLLKKQKTQQLLNSEEKNNPKSEKENQEAQTLIKQILSNHGKIKELEYNYIIYTDRIQLAKRWKNEDIEILKKKIEQKKNNTLSYLNSLYEITSS